MAEPGTLHGLAQTFLQYTGALAIEYMRGMKLVQEPEDGVAVVDLESPYSIQVSSTTFDLVNKLLAQVCSNEPVVVVVVGLLLAC